MDAIVITNHGPGDVYDLEIEGPTSEGLIARAEDGFPVPKLPPGKSVRAPRTKSLAHGHAPYFTVTLRAKTADGTEIQQEEFVSGD